MLTLDRVDRAYVVDTDITAAGPGTGWTVRRESAGEEDPAVPFLR
jgi:hypothetical protein